MTVHSCSALPAPEAASQVLKLLDAIGDGGFEGQLQHFLASICEADHFGVFRVHDGDVSLLGVDPTPLGMIKKRIYQSQQMWRLDPLICQAAQRKTLEQSLLVQTDLHHDVDPRARALLYDTIKDRYLLYGERAGAIYGMSVMRSFDAPGSGMQTIGRLQDCADLILSILSKHYEGQRRIRHVSKVLSSLHEIERVIQLHTTLPGREASVCARLVYGMMIPGIALDLEIGEESVKTYRKRLYRRLNVGGPRELLIWYLDVVRSGDAGERPARFEPASIEKSASA